MTWKIFHASQLSTKKLEESSPSLDPPCTIVLLAWSWVRSFSMGAPSQHEHGTTYSAFKNDLEGAVFTVWPLSCSLFPLCIHTILLPSKWKFFFIEGIKVKIFSQGERGTFLVLFLPLFVMLAPSQLAAFYFLSSVCVIFFFFFFCTVPEEKDFSVLTSCSLLHTFECSLLKASYLYTGTKYIPLTPCGITLHADCWALERWIECMTESFL